jgi:glycosyltransferase involved in cell wall biosynthesis
VHVTPFNEVIWDCGRAPTAVVEHGVPDPGHRYTGELAAAAVVINEPLRRWRVTGTDLLPRFGSAAPLDVFGMGVTGLARQVGMPPERLRELGDLPAERLHAEIARRRCYLHPVRWTSLGLSLIEAMHLGMPVVVLASTEAVAAVPPDAGVIATDVDTLVRGMRQLMDEPDLARLLGQRARQAALARYGLPRFLSDWDEIVERATRRPTRSGGRR